MLYAAFQCPQRDIFRVTSWYNCGGNVAEIMTRCKQIADAVRFDTYITDIWLPLIAETMKRKVRDIMFVSLCCLFIMHTFSFWMIVYIYWYLCVWCFPKCWSNATSLYTVENRKTKSGNLGGWVSTEFCSSYASACRRQRHYHLSVRPETFRGIFLRTHGRWPQIWYADISWLPSEVVRCWWRSVDFPQLAPRELNHYNHSHGMMTQAWNPDCGLESKEGNQCWVRADTYFRCFASTSVCCFEFFTRVFS